MQEVLPQVNQEEHEAALDKEMKMWAMAMNMTPEERFSICDQGYYNDTIKGYLIAAMQAAEFGRDEVKRALDGMKWALSETNAEEAAELYRKY